MKPPQHLIDLALEVSGWSPCQSKRGVVVFRGEDVVSHGHNFKPQGFECDGTDTCKATCRIEAIHAEQAAIIAAGGRPKTAGTDLLHVKSVGGYLVASDGPSCVPCSKLILAYGIVGVWLYHADGWQRYEAADFHRRSLLSLPGPQARSQPQGVFMPTPRAQLDDDDPIHTGDDDRLDHLTGIITAVEEVIDELNGHGEVVETLRGVLEDCTKLDALLLQTIQREREAQARSPQEPNKDETEKSPQ